MNKLLLKLLTFKLLVTFSVNAQSTYHSGKLKIFSTSQDGNTYDVYDFTRDDSDGKQIKAKYFATNAYSQYLNWKTGKDIILIAPGAYSDDWGSNAKPIGMCVDNGTIVNYNIESNMDGFVIVYNGGSLQGGIGVIDLDKNGVKTKEYGTYGNPKTYYPRNNSDRVSLLDWGEENGLTLFQSHLVYSSDKDHSENFKNLSYGKKQERRFLAICKKDGVVHHVIVNSDDNQYLMVGAYNAKSVLDNEGYYIYYMLNLDRGGKDLLFINKGWGLKNLYSSTHRDRKIENATNLIVYYLD